MTRSSLNRRTFLAQAAAASSLVAWRRSTLASAQQGASKEGAAEAWKNWSGGVHWTPARVSRPKSVEEVVAAVRAAGKAGEGVRVAGTGHSFVPLCATNGTTMLLTGLSGVESIDTEKREATVLAGTKLYELEQPLREAGLAMTTLPDIDRQAVAGAIATATHGTGANIPSLSNLVVGARFVSGSGEIVECSKTERPDLLRAAQVSLGALGVFTHLRLSLVPAFRLLEKTWIEPFEAVAQAMDQHIASHRHFEFFWVSDRDLCLLKSLDETDDAEDREEFEDEERLVGERVGWSGQIFPSTRNRRFHEIEYSVPAERGVDCLRELRDLMMGKHKDVTWPIEYRTVAPDDAYLSPMYMRPTVTISLHQAANLEYQTFFADAEAIFRNHAGRPHWGKIHTLEAAELAELYPEWETFLRLRAEVDPNGRFSSDYLRGVFGV